MGKTLSSTIIMLMAIMSLSQWSHAFEAPARPVTIKPQLILLFPDDLMVTENNTSYLGKEMGPGFGLKIRTRLAGPIGYTINAAIADVQTDDTTMGSAVMFTAGLCYTKTLGFGSITLELGYGEISAAECASTLFMPSIEFSHFISDRVALSVEVAMPVVNDWFYGFGVKEKFRSVVVGLGSSICF